MSFGLLVVELLSQPFEVCVNLEGMDIAGLDEPAEYPHKRGAIIFGHFQQLPDFIVFRTMQLGFLFE